MQDSKEHLQQHYIDLKDRPFFKWLMEYMRSGPMVAIVWQDMNMVKTVHVVLGEANPVDPVFCQFFFFFFNSVSLLL